MIKRHKLFRGQATTCTGCLTITLSGPQGVGKSLVARLLKVILPVMPVNEVVIIEETK